MDFSYNRALHAYKSGPGRAFNLPTMSRIRDLDLVMLGLNFCLSTRVEKVSESD